ncbi:hypothetical protein LC55x_0437 [Lysobacter capsici]|nr:hypothetical protein LC55x_0437 [Lysobacter capsici]
MRHRRSLAVVVAESYDPGVSSGATPQASPPRGRQAFMQACLGESSWGQAMVRNACPCA